MASKVSVPDVVKDADKVIGVWKVNPTFSMMGTTLAVFSASTRTVRDMEAVIEAKRQELSGLVDRRDDEAKALSKWVTRARSGIRSNFGPDSAEYAQAGGVRQSERKHPTRKPKV
jgi:uncharacterized protein YqgV (UPF0045/DUF77 family)